MILQLSLRAFSSRAKSNAIKSSYFDSRRAFSATKLRSLDNLDFAARHIGPNEAESKHMLNTLGYNSMNDFLNDTIPSSIRIDPQLINDQTIPPLSEAALLQRARDLAGNNEPFKSYIGMGYHNAVIPSPIRRKVLENPAWYTPYTPYQAEVAQGRLESLINFQTMVISLTAMDIANASLLDEATAAAEAMVMSFVSTGQTKKVFLVEKGVLPQTQSVLHTRAKGFVQYPDVNGYLTDFRDVTRKIQQSGGLVSCATDLLALAVLQPPGEWGADIVLGNSARFGVPAGYGGPHAAFFACRDKLKRKMPGRLIGLTRDSAGRPAYRLALQTREQHIRREKATSNICTSQALLANLAAFYAIYHGPDGISRIAKQVHKHTSLLYQSLLQMGYKIHNDSFFDTLTIGISDVLSDTHLLQQAAAEMKINLRIIDSTTVGVTLDESVTTHALLDIINVFSRAISKSRIKEEDLPHTLKNSIPELQRRQTPILTQPVFNKYHSETELMRYVHHLESKDLSLVHSMIPLGSCTMKLNSASSMLPLTWPEFSSVHPFAPIEQVRGYKSIITELESYLAKITGFHACSLQPNSGAAGEYAGLSVIKEYHEARGDHQRNICLIPLSAHGTNPASAIMAGLKVVPVKTLPNGNLDLSDLRAKAEQYSKILAAFMITYPSTFGVFEEGVQEACNIIHKNGGMVYLDGANLNAQIGLTNPSTCGGDVCHLNLHKTFAIPHGGGGPGVGPICVTESLAQFLPSHPIVTTGGSKAINAVSAAPFGSASILLISWAYITMLGGCGLSRSSHVALLNANYIAFRLHQHYNIRFKNGKNRVAHELLIDLAEFDKSVGLKVTDFAKRLQDYGFHPPTCAWPISTCMLVEPTESESLEELDRFCDSMIQIRREVQDVIDGNQPRENNLLKNAPHPISVVTASEDQWQRPYSRQMAAFPLPWLQTHKFWPSISRIDDAYGDMNLICECPSVEESAISED